MDNSVAVYISEVFSPEQRDDILTSFDLYEDFELQNYDEDFIELIMMMSYDTTENTFDTFQSVVHKKLDYIVNEHRVKLIPGVSLYKKNEILKGLSRLLTLEDYTPVLTMLETLETTEIKFANILSDLTSLDEVDILEIVEYVSPVTLVSLKSYATTKETVSDADVNYELMSRASAFFKCFEQDTIGKQLAPVSLLGQTFKDYLAFVKEELITDDNHLTVLNILSVLILSSDGYKDLLTGYRNNSNLLFDDIRKASLLEELVIKYNGQFNEYWSIQIEKNRLS